MPWRARPPVRGRSDAPGGRSGSASRAASSAPGPGRSGGGRSPPETEPSPRGGVLGEGEGPRRARPVVVDKRQLDQVEALVAALREGAQLFVLESDARVVGQPRPGSQIANERLVDETVRLAGRGLRR